MPELFIPFMTAVGCWLTFGFLCMPGEYNRKTTEHRIWGAFAAAAFIVMCFFGGKLLASYVPPYKESVSVCIGRDDVKIACSDD